MPRLSDDEDVQLFVDDGPTQRRGLVAYRARVDAAERQTAAVPADERVQKGRRGLVDVCNRRCEWDR